jgi:A/G-specific adenine glycosylase
MTTSFPKSRDDAGTGIPCLDIPPPIGTFRRAVLDYYRANGRDLPWRKTTEPYHILVSEIMLQQTQAGRVTQKYPAFIGTFPDFRLLAKAPLPEVLAAWQGMGYNRRAIALQACARKVCTEYGGELPADPEILATFPGIGRATACSICAFAFNMPVVFIETNIRRVFIHYFFGSAATVDDREILPLAKEALYRKDPRTWYNALMDLGTDLKKVAGNPNRHSRHYTRQAAFEGSDRKIRGAIVTMLLGKKQMTIDEIARKYPDDAERIARILGDLEKEGFLSCCGGGYSIAPA